MSKGTTAAPTNGILPKPGRARKRQIKMCSIGGSGSGKTCEIKCWHKSFQSQTNRDGQRPPRQPLLPDTRGAFPLHVAANTENVTKWKCNLVSNREDFDFTMYDLRGGWISEFLSGKDSPELKKIMATSRLVVFVVSPEDAANRKHMEELSAQYASVAKELLKRAARRGEPQPFLALAFTMSDDYGTGYGRDPRLIRSPEALRAARAGAREFLDGTHLGDDEAARRLLELTRKFWEEVAPRATFFNAYMVSADPESSLWEDWHDRGALQLSSDFFEYLLVTQPPRRRLRGLLGAGAAALLCALGLLAWGLNTERAAEDAEVANELFGEPRDGGLKLGLARYTPDRAKALGAATTYFGPDYSARQLVLLHVRRGYDRLWPQVAEGNLLNFHQDASRIKFDSEREAEARNRDPVARDAVGRYENDLAALQSMADAFSQFHKKHRADGAPPAA
jgi:hypothetical protein